MNPFPLNRLVRVHRVHVLGLSTPKMVPGHGHLASSPTQPIHISHRWHSHRPEACSPARESLTSHQDRPRCCRVA
jgi:hypothetical protein